VGLKIIFHGFLVHDFCIAEKKRTHNNAALRKAKTNQIKKDVRISAPEKSQRCTF